MNHSCCAVRLNPLTTHLNEHSRRHHEPTVERNAANLTARTVDLHKCNKNEGNHDVRQSLQSEGQPERPKSNGVAPSR